MNKFAQACVYSLTPTQPNETNNLFSALQKGSARSLLCQTKVSCSHFIMALRERENHSWREFHEVFQVAAILWENAFSSMIPNVWEVGIPLKSFLCLSCVFFVKVLSSVVTHSCIWGRVLWIDSLAFFGYFRLRRSHRRDWHGCMRKYFPFYLYCQASYALSFIRSRNSTKLQLHIVYNFWNHRNNVVYKICYLSRIQHVFMESFKCRCSK